MNRAVQNLKQRLAVISRLRPLLRATCLSVFLVGALCLPAIAANDTYGTLLDKRFEGQPKVEATNEHAIEQSPEAAAAAAKVADLEQALKKRAANAELDPEAPPAPNVNLGVSIMIGVGIGLLLTLKVLFILHKVRAHKEAKALAREEAFIKSVVAEPTVASLLNDLKNRLDANEALPEAHAAVCRTEGEKVDDKAILKAAVEVFESAPLFFLKLRARFEEITTNPEVTSKLKDLEDFSREIRPSTRAAKIPALRSHRLFAIALEGFLKQLSTRPKNITPWRMRLIKETLELFEELCVPNLSPDLATQPRIRLLVVDDCAVSRHAMVFALKKVFHEPDLAEGGKQALELAEKNTYDVIFLDIEMPGMDGFELCTKIRETQLNKKTPIVFVTSHDNLESRMKIVKKGAQDLIGKPYLPTEVTLKALQLSLYGRLKLSAIEIPKPGEAQETAPAPVMTAAPSAA